MYRDNLERPLADLGLTPENFHALRLLPLLYVAWANARMTDIERQRILDVARNKLELGSSAMQLVHHWLERPPSDELVRKGVACLKKIARAPDQPDLGTDELLQTLWEAETMTRQVALLTGVPYEASEQQHDALLELAELMEVDSGVTWLDLLEDLGGPTEVRRTLKRSPPDRSSPKPASRTDRLRRWRTAVRLESEHGASRPATGGLV